MVFNSKACGVQGRSPDGGRGGKCHPPIFFNRMDGMFFDKKFQNFISVHINVRDAECVEINEKSILRFI